MAKKNRLQEALPYSVEQRLTRLGHDIKTARVRRGLTIQEIAEKIGTGPRAVSDAEKGKPSTGIAVYMALLWVLDLLSQMDDVADPAKDEEGLRLAMSREKTRAVSGIKKELDDDF